MNMESKDEHYKMLLSTMRQRLKALTDNIEPKVD